MPKALAIRSKRLPKSVTRPSRFLPARMKTKFMPVGRPKKRGQTNRTARLANRRMRCLLHVPLQPTGGDKAEKQPSCLCRSAHGLDFLCRSVYTSAVCRYAFYAAACMLPACLGAAFRIHYTLTPAGFSGAQADRSRAAESHAFVGPCRACAFLRITKAAQPMLCRLVGLL